MADEVAALQRMSRYADIPACVLAQTIADERTVIASEPAFVGSLISRTDDFERMPLCFERVIRTNLTAVEDPVLDFGNQAVRREV